MTNRSTPWPLVPQTMSRTTSRSVKFHCGQFSQQHHLKSQILKCGHCSHMLKLVNHSVSRSLLRLPVLPLVVHSLSGHIVLLFCHLAIHQYSQLPSHEVLWWRALAPCPNAGPIAPIENEMTGKALNRLHLNGYHNFACLQWQRSTLQMLLNIIPTSILTLVNCFLVPPSKANIHFMMMTPLHHLHDLLGYIKPNRFLSSLQL